MKYAYSCTSPFQDEHRAAECHYRRLLNYSGVVDNSKMEKAVTSIARKTENTVILLHLCSVNCSVRKPTGAWAQISVMMLRAAVGHPELASDALQITAELRAAIAVSCTLDFSMHFVNVSGGHVRERVEA